MENTVVNRLIQFDYRGQCCYKYVKYATFVYDCKKFNDSRNYKERK